MPESTTQSLPDYYEVLQVSPKVNREVIEVAYKRLVENCHLSVNTGDPSVSERLALLDRAFAVLFDPVKRLEYNWQRMRNITSENRKKHPKHSDKPNEKAIKPAAPIPSNLSVSKPPTPQLPDYYEILQVSPNADVEFIVAAYKRLVEKWHLDRQPGDPKAFERLTLLDKALAILTDYESRKEYDSLRSKRTVCDSVQEQSTNAELAQGNTTFEKTTEKTYDSWLYKTIWISAVASGLLFAIIVSALSQQSIGKTYIISTKSNAPQSVSTEQENKGNSPYPAIAQPSATITPIPAEVLFSQISPSVVNIITFDRKGQTEGSGTGFLLNKCGLIATNFHVIERAHSAQIILSDNLKISVLGVAAFDRESDLAIIQAKVPLNVNLANPNPQTGIENRKTGPDLVSELYDLKPLELNKNELPIGARVYAIGNPLGLANTLSEGLISGYREIDKSRVLQTTASISPGSSGGPLLGADGKVIGVTTFQFKGGQNLNFAVPASKLSHLYEQINSKNKLTSFPLKSRAEVESHIQLGISLSLKGEYENSIKEFNEAIRVDPNNSAAYNWRGISYSKIGEANFALKDYSEAIRIDPKNDFAISNRGTIWLERKEFEKANEDFSEAIRINPKNSGYYYYRGTVLHIQKDYTKAIADFSESIRLDSTFAKSFLGRASVYHMIQDYDNAIEDYTRSIGLDPINPKLYFFRGRAKEGKGQYDSSIEDYNDAILIDPTYEMAKKARATAIQRAKARR